MWLRGETLWYWHGLNSLRGAWTMLLAGVKVAKRACSVRSTNMLSAEVVCLAVVLRSSTVMGMTAIMGW
jgi:hypothetical protein